MEQIQNAQEQVAEAQKLYDASKANFDRLSEKLNNQNLEKINKEEEDRQVKKQLKEYQDTLKQEKFN